jgi:hypothetical protein
MRDRFSHYCTNRVIYDASVAFAIDRDETQEFLTAAINPALSNFIV